MRNASAALIAFLNSATEFAIADLVTIIPVSGSTLYLTNAPVNITATSQVDNLSHTFTAGGGTSGSPTFTRDKVKLTVGLEVDNMGLTLITSASQTVNGVPWPQAARQGYFDGSRIVLERCYMPTYGDTSKGTLIEFWGRAGEVKPSRNAVQITVVSDLALLDIQLPKNLYGAGCLHNLYDAGCTLVKASFTVTGTVGASSTTSTFNTNLIQADGYFELGAITFTSGALNGQTFTVKTYKNASGAVSPTAAASVAPSNGDTFSIYPGCDKSQGTCTSKFSNLAHFRGYPYIPAPENAR